MKISKKNDTYDIYALELSFSELTTILGVLEKDHAGVIADDLYAGVNWYIGHLPGPGEEKEDLEKPGAANDTGELEPKPKEDEGVPPLPGEEPQGAPGAVPGGEEPAAPHTPEDLEKVLPEPPAE